MTSTPRPRGRPRSEISRRAVVEAAAALFVEGGIDAVTIVSVAKRLDVSRATLYRMVPTKEDLLGILFESSTDELTAMVASVIAERASAADKLAQLIELQVNAAIRMRRYMPVFFGGAGLPPDVFARWQVWSREFEDTWAEIVADAMDEGALERAEVVIATRAILGMCIWISRWYRPGEGLEPEVIAATAVTMILPGRAAVESSR